MKILAGRKLTQKYIAKNIEDYPISVPLGDLVGKTEIKFGRVPTSFFQINRDRDKINIRTADYRVEQDSLGIYFNFMTRLIWRVYNNEGFLEMVDVTKRKGNTELSKTRVYEPAGSWFGKKSSLQDYLKLENS